MSPKLQHPIGRKELKYFKKIQCICRKESKFCRKERKLMKDLLIQNKKDLGELCLKVLKMQEHIDKLTKASIQLFRKVHDMREVIDKLTKVQEAVKGETMFLHGEWKRFLTESYAVSGKISPSIEAPVRLPSLNFFEDETRIA